MAIVTEPLSPWYIIVTLLAIGAVALLLGRSTSPHRRTLGQTRKTRLVVILLSLLAAVLFATASWNPHLSRASEMGSLHLAIVVDVSDSVLRAKGGWPQIQAQVHDLIKSSVDAAPEEVRRQGTASILTFGKSTVVAEREIPLTDLPSAFNRLNHTSFAIGDESNIEAGLARAGELIEQAGGRGVILLISDGHQTVGDAPAAAQQLARRGIAIYVHPVAGRTPELAIAAADLPRQVDAGRETFVRGVLWNGSSSEASARLTLTRNPGVRDADRFGAELVSETPVSMLVGTWARFRQPVKFQGPGLQTIEVTLERDGEGGQHQRRFFIHVNQPPKVLVIGGDTHWAGALSPAIVVTQIQPEALSGEIGFHHFDAVVIDGIPAHQFSDDVPNMITEAVEMNGTGLMVINGAHQGADEWTETMLMSYHDTALEPILPVTSKPDPEHMAHQVVILMDASGSMLGEPIAKSKEIARYIVQNLLQARDRLDLITFTTDARHLVQDQLMDDEGKHDAINHINAIAASGGTDPSVALALIADRMMTNCSLIFISDGFFDRVAERPDCQATVFAIGHESVPSDSPLWDLADPIPAPVSFDPSRIEIASLKPWPRFFEPGSFKPRAMGAPLRQNDRLPVPDLAMQGTAMSYVKQDADLIAVRPKLAVPVLAYRETVAGHVGALTTAVPPSWLESEAGRQAISAWIAHVIPYAERGRYDFQLADHGDTIEIQVSLIAKEGKVPAVERLDAAIIVQGETPVIRRLQPDPIAPATFSGRIPVPQDARTQEATLLLSEFGPDALSRPQHIPILLPRSIGTAAEALPPKEAYSYDLNEPLLQAIAGPSGDAYNPSSGTSFFRGRTMENRGEPLWPLLVTAATVCYLCAIATRRLDF